MISVCSLHFWNLSPWEFDLRS